MLEVGHLFFDEIVAVFISLYELKNCGLLWLQRAHHVVLGGHLRFVSLRGFREQLTLRLTDRCLIVVFAKLAFFLLNDSLSTLERHRCLIHVI